MTLPPPAGYKSGVSNRMVRMPRGSSPGLSAQTALGENRNMVNATNARDMLKDFGIKDSKVQSAILEAVVSKSEQGSAKLYDQQQLVTAARTHQATLLMTTANSGGGDDEENADA
jgi:hypothetical protein